MAWLLVREERQEEPDDLILVLDTSKEIAANRQKLSGRRRK